MGKKLWNVLLALCLILAVSSLVLPARAESQYYATSPDGSLHYSSPEIAWDAARRGLTIVLQRDWTLSDRLVLGENKVATIYMNGYRIDRALSDSESDGEVIYLDEGATLTLIGCGADGVNVTGRTFSLSSGYEDGSLTGGGLITGGYSSNGAGGIHMKNNSKLILDNVIVGGNRTGSYEYGGGINMNNTGCTLTMKNGAAVAYNSAEYGGGVYVASRYLSIDMSDGSKIVHNYAMEDGGGIYSSARNTTVTLTGGSYISDNKAAVSGGGYYGYYSYNTITSPDKTGILSGNTAKGSGGAVYLARARFSSNENTFSGLTFLNNSSAGGGAISIQQEWTTISDCIMTGNHVNGLGGAIDNFNDHTTIRDCIITGNSASRLGGGVYNDNYQDISLHGKVVIKNNIRSETNTPDDLYLESGSSYMDSCPDAGSEIGILTSAATRRQVGDDAEFDTRLFFSDAEGFCVLYDSSEKELYLVSQENASFPVTVNGRLQGYYNEDAIFTIDGTPEDPDQVFLRWTEENNNTRFLDNITAVNATVSTTSDGETHKMALSFQGKYAYRISNVMLTVDKPVAGQELPATGTLTWTDPSGIPYTRTVPVTWQTQTQAVTGTAVYGTDYAVCAKLEEDTTVGILFADNVTGNVVYTETDGDQTDSVCLDDARTLHLYGNPIRTNSAPEETTIDSSRFDVNMDGTVDQLDITRAQLSFSTMAQSANWNARADVNGDGEVDIIDLIMILNNYTKR